MGIWGFRCQGRCIFGEVVGERYGCEVWDWLMARRGEERKRGREEGGVEGKRREWRDWIRIR